MKISGRTKVVALLGYPVDHSLSPDMHNRAFDALGLDYCYVAFPVHPAMLREAAMAVRALNMAGVNVTVPHKETVMPFLDKIDSEASFIGAVNTVVNKSGKLVGHNTDGRGFMKSLEQEAVEVSGKKVMILGAGGASRAISYYLSEKAADLVLFDIDSQKANRLRDDLLINRKNVRAITSPDAVVAEMDVIINATPLGLKTGDPLPLDSSKISGRQIVGDLIYKDTPFQHQARKIGCKTFNGLGMLLWQGVLASQLWTGTLPPHDVMRQALVEGLR